MRRADRRPPQRRLSLPLCPRRRPLAGLVAALAASWLGAAGPAARAADAAAPRYTPPAPEAALLPAQPGLDPQPGALFLGERSGLDYAANAAVARLVVEVARDGVPADGQSGVGLTLRLFDRDGKPLRERVTVTLEVSGGRLLLPGARSDEQGPRGLDADPATPGTQVVVSGGVLSLTLLAPDQAQDVRVRASAGDQTAAGTISFVPELRPMLGVGLVEGVINLRRGGIEPVQRGDVFEREIRSWSRSFSGGKASLDSRVAFYLKGQVRGDVLLTAAYDSDKDVRARLLRDIRPDELYPVYGDASLRSTDARSADRLFVRLDHGKSYALLGDFQTGEGFTQQVGQGQAASLKQRSLGAWSRSATGLRAHHERAGLTANISVFEDSLRQVVEEFASQGSGPYGLRNNAVLEGSEKLEVLVRDRAQPSRILSVRALQRGVDYSFEPFSGRILLAQFLGALDAQLNPQTLRVTYEVDQGGERFWAGLLDAQWQLLEGPGLGLELGGAVARDANPLAPYTLASANATLRFGPRSALVLEVARSQSQVNTNPVNVRSGGALGAASGDISGQAWRLELAHEGQGHRVSGLAARSGDTFDNPAAPLAPGRREALLKAEATLAAGLALEGEAVGTADTSAGGGSRNAAGIGLRWQIDPRLTLQAGLRSQRETVGTQGNGYVIAPFGSTAGLGGSLAGGAAGGALGYGNQAIDAATGLPMISGSSLTTTAATLPAGTRLASDSLRLGLGWRATERVTLGGEVEHDVHGDDRRRLALGADWRFAERARVYGRVERQSGWVQWGGLTDTGRAATVLALGVDGSFWRDTQAFSEYRLRDAIAGRDAQVASGIRQGFDLAPGLRGNAGLEWVDVVAGSSARSQAVTLGLDYTGSELWKAGTRIEHRRSGDLAATPEDERFHTTLWQLMGVRKLDRDWTLLARNHLLHTGYAARGSVTQDRAQLGLAWRPVDHNRFNALGRVEVKSERDGSDASVGTLASQALIGALLADWHPSRPWWFTGRMAAKWQVDQFEGGTRDHYGAQLLAGRFVYDVTERWDIGALAALQFGRYGARQQALGMEAGYGVATNLWLSAGFNWSGFVGDADLSGYEYTRRGAYLRLRFKFDETLFSRGDPQVNRALDR